MAPGRKKGGRKRAKTRAAKRGTRRKTGSGAARGGHPRRSRAARSGHSPRLGAGSALATRSPPRSLTDRLAGIFERAAVAALRRSVDVGGRAAPWRRVSSGVRRETGAYLRELRELAGLTVDELAAAVELRDKKVIEAVEAGTATLSFELVLRLAAVLARHDPLPFVSRMVRSHNPVLWEILEDWGLGRLPLQLERERSFVNVLRGHDDARVLSDEEFADLLEFTRAAFELGLGFATRKRSGRSTRARRRG